MVTAECHVGKRNEEDDTIELERVGTLTAKLFEGYSSDVIDRIDCVE
jgi:hypothetical protein